MMIVTSLFLVKVAEEKKEVAIIFSLIWPIIIPVLILIGPIIILYKYIL